MDSSEPEHAMQEAATVCDKVLPEAGMAWAEVSGGSNGDVCCRGGQPAAA